MLYGADYYPEHWDKSEWESQAALMEQAHLNVVRIAEFAWKKIEPEEGRYDFKWLDEAIEVLAGHNVKVILGTPTAVPPVWAFNKYDLVMHDRYGRRRPNGSRRACCANNSDYLHLTEMVVTKMAKHYKRNKNVIGWQIDNEFGCHMSTRCYCPSCKKAFAKWIEDRFGTVDEVNRRFGNAFWSLDYDSFEDIELPGYTSCEGELDPLFAHNPTLDQEYRRFASASWEDYCQFQCDIIRKYSDAPITHNFMGHFSDIDYYKLGKSLDYVSWDNYPDNQWGQNDYLTNAMAHELMYGIKKQNFVVMEEQSGPCGWVTMGQTPRPGQLRYWVYQALAHGASGIVFFRFMACRFGMEQYWYGILDHDGKPRRRYNEIKNLGSELLSVGGLFENSKPKADTLVVKSYDNVWMHEIKNHTKQFNYFDIQGRFFAESSKLGVTTAHGDGGYEDYKVVILPCQQYVSPRRYVVLNEFLAGGGSLVLTFRSGLRDVDNNMLSETVPGPLAKLAGIEVEEFDALRSTVPITGAVEGSAGVWCDVVSLHGAEVLSCYGGEYYKGTPAITVNKVGNGKVYYVACDLDEATTRAFLEYVYREAGISVEKNLPYGVEAVKRVVNNKEYTVLLNSNDAEVEYDGGFKGRINQIDGVTYSGVLKPFDAVII